MPYIGNITQDFNVNNAMLDTDSVTSIKIVDGTIEGADIAANLDLSDTQKIRLGAGNDLQIYHNGSHSYIDDAGTGNLYIRSSQLVLQNAAGDEDLAILSSNGAVKLYFDDSKKFETTSEGVLVTNLHLGDLGFIELGASDDFRIYHDGTDSYLYNLTGEFKNRAATWKVVNQANNESMIVATENGSVDLYYDNSKKFETTSTGILIDGSDTTGSEVRGDFRFKSAGSGTTKILWDSSGDEIRWNDNYFASFGTGSDLKIYHDGTHSYIQNSTGSLINFADTFLVNKSDNSENILRGFADGAVELYYNGSKKLETKSDGIDVTGEVQCDSLDVDGGFNIDGSQITYDASSNVMKFTDDAQLRFGSGNDLRIYHNGTSNIIQAASNDLNIRMVSSENAIVARQNGAAELYYDNSKKFETTSTGATLTGNATINGEIIVNDDININADNKKLNIGLGADLQLYHDGSNSYVADNGAGELRLASNNGNGVRITKSDAESLANFTNDGRCELYHDNILSLATTTEGIEIQKTASGQTARLKIESTNGGQAGIELKTALVGTNRAARIDMYNQNALQWSIFNDYQQNGTNDFSIRHGAEMGIRALPDAQVELYYDNSKHFQTTSDGVEVDGELMIDPDAGGTLKFTGHAAHHSKMIIGDNGGTANGNLLIEGGDGSDFIQIGSNGDVLISEAISLNTNAKLAVASSGINPRVFEAHATHASFQGITLQSVASRNTTNGSYRHFQCVINGVADKMRVADSGNVTNSNNSYGAISDERLKENIVDASSQWDDIKALRIRKFNFKSLTDPDQKPMLGVVAQEAELVCPNLVTSEVTLQEGEEKEYKSFKYSVLYMKAIKCLQEAQAKIETLETKVAALEAA